MRGMKFPSFVLVCIALAASAAGAGELRVADAWARATPPGIDVGAAYFTITNDGADDRLIRVESPVAQRAELHITSMDGGVARMRKQDAIPVAGSGETRFAPGGRHVMLLGLKRPLEEGARFPLRLVFEHAGTLEVSVEVRGMGRDGMGAGHRGHAPR